jgi:mannose-1-phosphate guanylyltransferase
MIQRVFNEEDSLVYLANSAVNRVALLLAGGDGMRLRELTCEITGAPIPKQYCPLLHGASLLEATLSRAQLFTSRERINVVVNEDHLPLAKKQLQALPASNILIQPLNRDTGPGMLFALVRLECKHEDPIVAVFPTDHFVDDNGAFIAQVFLAVYTVSRMPDKIAVLGIAPDRPETGYGYILPEMPVGTHEGVYHVKAFVEKPSLIAAQDIISHGGVWNTFVMVFRLSRMMELLYELVPDECNKLFELAGSPNRAAELYQGLNSWNFSTQVLSRIPQHLIMLEIGNVHWSDWGTRESVERTYRSLNLVPFWNMSAPVSDLL